MQGTIFQILVLVTHGNMVLSGQPVASFYPQHSAFKFDEFVKFVDLERNGSRWSEKPFAKDPDDWLAKLKGQRCSGLRVERVSTDKKDLSDRMSVAFIGGGGRWLIEAVCPRGSEYWEPKWEIGDRNRPDQRIWRVTYGRIAQNQKASTTNFPSIEGLSSEMSSTLQDAISFSKKHKLDGFGKAFQSGYSALKADSEPELNGIAPRGQLPLPASRLLAASQAAWVFGGMGSWNDLGFEGDDQKQYEAISDRLFRLINSSLVATVNLSYKRAEKSWWKFWQ
ncbi:MAG: hypothetical protein EAZ37_06270 [Burkholderiales bacterium]|nr:MAG: hypothetical protein EAZ37_06270 [Burkholderiales bacterium]